MRSAAEMYRKWLTELININYILGKENEDGLGLTCQLSKCSFYNKGYLTILLPLSFKKKYYYNFSLFSSEECNCNTSLG